MLRKFASDGKEEMDLLNFSLIWREGEKGEPPRPSLYGRQTGDVMWGGGGRSSRGEISWVRRFFDVDMAFDYKEWSLS